MGNACSSAHSENDVAARTRQKTAPLPPNASVCDAELRRRRATTGNAPHAQSHHHAHPHVHSHAHHHGTIRLKTDDESGGGGERFTEEDRLRAQVKTEELDLDLAIDDACYSAQADAVHGGEEVVEDEEAEAEEEEEPARVAAVVRLVSLLKMSALSMASLAGAFYLTRKFAGHDLEMAEASPTYSGDMSSVEAQMLPARFEAPCISCSAKSIGTRATVVQAAANKATAKARSSLHDSYLSEFDFTPPRIYHNWWAATKFPNSYYSKSDTIKDYRFRRIFGW